MTPPDAAPLCPRCDQPNPAGTIFCRHCGATLVAARAPGPPGGAGAPTEAFGSGPASADADPTRIGAPPSAGPNGLGPEPTPADRRTMALIAGVVALIVVIGVVAFALGRSGSHTRRASATTVTTAAPSTTTPPTTTAPTTTTPPTTTPTTTTPPTTLAPTPLQALDAITAGLGANYATSGPVGDAASPYAAVDHVNLSGGAGTVIVDIYRFVANSWQSQASIPLPADQGAGTLASAATNSTPIVATSLTGSSLPDFAVGTATNSTPLLSVVSHASGQWVAVPFEGTPTGTANAVDGGQIQGNQVIGSYNTCTPDCANGTTVQVAFAYQAGVFQAAAQGDVSRNGHGHHGGGG